MHRSSKKPGVLGPGAGHTKSLKPRNGPAPPRFILPRTHNMDSVLIFRIGSIGDTVVALPCFHQVARSFPTSRRILVTDIPGTQKAAPAESVLENSGLIDEVIYFPPPPRKIVDILKLRKHILSVNCTTLIYIAD